MSATTHPPLPLNHPPRRLKAIVWTALVAVLVLAILATAAVNSLSGPPATPSTLQESIQDSTEWFTIRERDFDLTVTAEGELEAKSQVEIKSEVQGEAIIVQLVEEGTTVKEGDVLIRLADDQIKEKIEQERLAVESATAEKVAAQQSFKIEEKQAQTERRAAEVKLELAKLDLEKWLKGDIHTQRTELKLGLAKAQRMLERAIRDMKLSEQLFADKFISLNELEDDKLAKIEADADLETAQLAKEVFEAYTNPKENKKFTSDVDQAIEELDRTIAEGNRKIKLADSELLSKTRRLQIRQDRLAELENQLKATVIKAPQVGMVVYASSVGAGRQRDSPIAQGTQIHFNQTILLLPDMNQMVAALKVHEAMIPQVEQAQETVIYIDALPDHPIIGTISQVGVMAQDGGWWNRDIRQYKVKVDLPVEKDTALKPSMRCLGQINVGQVRTALAVPVQAIHSEGKQQFCYVRAGSHVRRQPVTIGRSSETLVEILSGLDQGKQVLLREPRPGEVVQ